MTTGRAAVSNYSAKGLLRCPACLPASVWRASCGARTAVRRQRVRSRGGVGSVVRRVGCVILCFAGRQRFSSVLQRASFQLLRLPILST